ncbi:MAG: prepilin-type N-terminal cleavage/methylation domain-containing protein [Deltaproteobacteria bacterium]|nr:prepilin-type N-terminal cleavage/methylation domain-containing protein [Deltaproteobacteria bacterium]
MIDMNRDDQRGFSLIEILIAITVFAIGILAVGNMQITAIKGNSFANDLTEAVTLAQSKMEELISLNYNDPLLDDGDLDGTNQDLDDDGIDDGGNDFGLNDIGNADGSEQYQAVGNLQYNIFWNIAPDEPTTDTKIIRVIVTWRSHGGLTRNVSFDAVKARI